MATEPTFGFRQASFFSANLASSGHLPRGDAFKEAKRWVLSLIALTLFWADAKLWNGIGAGRDRAPSYSRIVRALRSPDRSRYAIGQLGPG